MKEYSGADNDRIFLRNKLCDLLFDACSEPGYNPTSLSGYNATEWNELLEDLETTRAACWRSVGKDVLLSAQDRDDPSNTVVERTDEDDMKEHREFGRRYNVLVIACKIHAKLAEIRPKLERQVRRGGSGPPDLNPTKVASLL